MHNIVRIIGGGLAGAEAAWQLARRGIAVELFEMRPRQMTDAHAAVISASGMQQLIALRLLTAPAGLTQSRMRRLDPWYSLRRSTRVPAGSALAVDREQFSCASTRGVEELATVRIVRQEVRESP